MKDKIFFNKKFDFLFSSIFEIVSGIKLKGWEVKSIRCGHLNIKNSYVFIKNQEAYLSGLFIQPNSKTFKHYFLNSERNKKLLLKKKEILNLLNYSKNIGYSIVPRYLFWKRSWCKIKLSVVQGKKNKDKRLDIKKRVWKIEKDRILKRNFLNKLN